MSFSCIVEIFNSPKSIQEIGKSLGSTNQQFLDFLTTVKKQEIVFDNYDDAMAAFTKSMKGASLGAKALSVGIKALSSIGWMALISGLTTLFTKWIPDLYKNIAKTSEYWAEQADAHQENIDKIDEEIDKLTSEKEKLESLQTAIQDAGSDKKKLAEIQGELNGVLGDTYSSK